MITSTPEAKRLVIGSLAIAGTVAAAGDLAHGHAPKLRIFIGAMIAGAVLAMIAEVSPELAGGMAVLILVTALLAGGPTTYDKVRKLTNSPGAAPKPAGHAIGASAGGAAPGELDPRTIAAIENNLPHNP